MVADAAADRGERVFLADQRQGLLVAALGGQTQIALHGDVRGAGSLAGSRAGGDGILAVFAVVHIPVGLVPDRVGHLAIGGLRLKRGLGAELLAELQGVGRAVFHALPAGHALGLVHLGHEVGADHVPRAEHQTHAQAKAGAGAAVADGGALAGLLDVGHVVHQAVLLGAGDDLIDLFPADLAGAAGADIVLGALAHLDAHILLQVAAALADGPARGAARTGRDGEGVVFVDVVRQLVVVAHARDVLDGALNGHHAHQAVAVRHEGRHGRHADAGVLLKGLADLGVGLKQLLVVDQHLHDAGGKDLHEEAVLAVGGVGGDAEHADPGKVLGKLLDLFQRHAGLFGQILRSALLAQTRGDGDLGLLIGEDGGKGIVLRGVFVDLVHHAGESAYDPAQTDDLLSELCHCSSCVQFVPTLSPARRGPGF